MIAKEPFVAALNVIIKRQEIRDQLHKPLIEMGIEIGADPLEDAMVTLLDASLDLQQPPEGGMVGWWLYDCSSDRVKGKPTFMRLGADVITASTPEELYDMIVAYDKYMGDE